MSRPSVRTAILVLVVVTALVVTYLSPAGVRIKDWLESDHGPRGWGAAGPLAFVLLSALPIAIGIPRLLFAAIAGALFGWAIGFFAAEAGAMLGCVLTFLGGRHLGREFVESRFKDRRQRVQRIMQFAGTHGVACNLLIRSAPVGNFFITNLLMSVTPISTRDMLAGTFLGTMPGTLALALVGSGAGGGSSVRLIVGCACVLFWGVAYARFVRPWARGKVAAGLEEGGGEVFGPKR